MSTSIEKETSIMDLVFSLFLSIDDHYRVCFMSIRDRREYSFAWLGISQVMTGVFCLPVLGSGQGFQPPPERSSAVVSSPLDFQWFAGIFTISNRLEYSEAKMG